MNKKSLMILAAVTLIVGVVAAVMLSKSEARVRSTLDTSKLVPSLLSSINDVHTVEIKRKEGTTTLQQDAEKNWGVAEKKGYPADVEAIRKLLIGIADMTKVEPKTSDTSRYAQLGVEEPTAEGATSSLVTLKDASGKDIAQVIVGKEYQAKKGFVPDQRYVRLPNDPQSWLVKAKLEMHENSTDWLVKKILEIKRDRVRSVEVTHPDGEKVFVDRDKPETNDFVLHDVPEGKELKYATVANAMSSTLEYLNLDDVVPAADVDFATNPGAVSRFVCFDGLVLTVKIKEDGEKCYARFEASYEAPPATPDAPATEAPAPEKKDEAATPDEAAKKPEIKKPEEVQKEVAELNARLSAWTFLISSYNKTTFAKHMADMVKDKAPPPPPEGEGGAADGDQKDSYMIPGDLPPEIQKQIQEHQESLGHKTVTAPPKEPPKDEETTEKPPPQ